MNTQLLSIKLHWTATVCRIDKGKKKDERLAFFHMDWNIAGLIHYNVCDCEHNRRSEATQLCWTNQILSKRILRLANGLPK